MLHAAAVIVNCVIVVIEQVSVDHGFTLRDLHPWLLDRLTSYWGGGGITVLLEL